jgi:hypothetical protein
VGVKNNIVVVDSNRVTFIADILYSKIPRFIDLAGLAFKFYNFHFITLDSEVAPIGVINQQNALGQNRISFNAF